MFGNQLQIAQPSRLFSLYCHTFELTTTIGTFRTTLCDLEQRDTSCPERIRAAQAATWWSTRWLRRTPATTSAGPSRTGERGRWRPSWRWRAFGWYPQYLIYLLGHVLQFTCWRCWSSPNVVRASLATSSARVRRRSALRLVTVATDDKIVPTATTSRTSTAGTTRARGRSSVPNWTTGVSSHRSTVATLRQTLTVSSRTLAVRPSSSSAWGQGCKLWIRCFLHSSPYPSSTLSWSSWVHLST